MANTKLNPNQLPDTAPQSVTVTLTADEIKALKVSPIQLVAAPGEGFAFFPLYGFWIFEAGDDPYVIGDAGNPVLALGTDTTVYGGDVHADSTKMEGTEDYRAIFATNGMLGGDSLASDCDNKAMYLTVSGSEEFTEGNGTAKVIVSYILMNTSIS